MPSRQLLQNIGGNCRGNVEVSLKHLEAPCILYNLNGYYDDLKALLNHMIEKVIF